jgi:ketosteroid isomerase-like protein
MGEAREVMDRLTEAVFSKDLEALKELYAPDAVAETPEEGTLRGRDQIVAWVGTLMTAFPDASYELTRGHESGADAIDEGDHGNSRLMSSRAEPHSVAGSVRAWRGS